MLRRVRLRVQCADSPELSQLAYTRYECRTGAFLRYFIEYALLRGLGVFPSCIGPGVKPCGRKWFRAFHRAKMSPQDRQLHFSSKNQIKYSKTCLKRSLKKTTKTWSSSTYYRLLTVESIAECYHLSLRFFFV